MHLEAIKNSISVLKCQHLYIFKSLHQFRNKNTVKLFSYDCSHMGLTMVFRLTELIALLHESIIKIISLRHHLNKIKEKDLSRIRSFMYSQPSGRKLL